MSLATCAAVAKRPAAFTYASDAATAFLASAAMSCFRTWPPADAFAMYNASNDNDLNITTAAATTAIGLNRNAQRDRADRKPNISDGQMQIT